MKYLLAILGFSFGLGIASAQTKTVKAAKPAPVQTQTPSQIEKPEEVAKSRASLNPAYLREDSTLSSSKQFKIIGANVDLRNALATQAEEVKKNILKLLSVQDGFKGLIVINLKTEKKVQGGSPFSQQIEIIGESLVFTLNIKILQGFENEEFKNKITEILLYERALRNVNLRDIPQKIELPAWVIFGINEAIAWKSEQRDRSIYAGLFERNGLISVEETLNTKDPKSFDGVAQIAYRASCGCLVLSLLESPGGARSFQRFLDQITNGSGDSRDLLNRHFPALQLSKRSLEKWWTLQLASMSQAPLTERLSILETERRLDEMLRVSLVKGEAGQTEVVPIAEWQKIQADPTRASALMPAYDSLVHLSYRCFPLYQSIIKDYLKILAGIASGKPKGIEKSLQQITQTRASMKTVGRQSRDYLDWYEITQGLSKPEFFKEYFSAMELLRREKPPRENEMSRYIDEVEKLMETR